MASNDGSNSFQSPSRGGRTPPTVSQPRRHPREHLDRETLGLFIVVTVTIAALTGAAGYGFGALRARPALAGVASLRCEADGACEARCVP